MKYIVLFYHGWAYDGCYHQGSYCAQPAVVMDSSGDEFSVSYVSYSWCSSSV